MDTRRFYCCGCWSVGIDFHKFLSLKLVDSVAGNGCGPALNWTGSKNTLGDLIFFEVAESEILVRSAEITNSRDV